jgi:hypothetical protein
MSLYNYLVKSDVSGTEIRLDFQQEEVKQLYSTLKGLGLQKYRDFVQDNLPDILKYIALSRSQRKQKKWANHPDNILIRCAALQITDTTHLFLQNIQEVSGIVDSGSYRSFEIVVSREIAPLFFSNPFEEFPFDEYDCPFPQ